MSHTLSLCIVGIPKVQNHTIKMVRLTLIVLQILLATSAVLTKTINSGEELIFIGKFRSSRAIEGGEGRVIDEGNYYISPNSANWAAAQTDCRNQLGPNGTLVAIESEEEWEFLVDTLIDYGFGTTYWTSGMYDPSRTVWRWTVNDIPLPPFAPWGSGYPSTPNTLLRVLVYYTNEYDASWRTVSNSQLNRYICEVQVPTIAVPCYQTNDLAIVLDSSGSIGAANFEIAKYFVNELANAFTVNSPSRLAFITYSSEATTRIDLTNTLSRGAISSTILATPWEAGNTYTNLAIDLAVQQLTSTPRAVPLNMVVLTDGESTVPSATIASANAANALGIRVFSVGITPSVNQQELLTIAGNDPNRVFTTVNFDELVKLLAPLSLKICPL